MTTNHDTDPTPVPVPPATGNGSPVASAPGPLPAPVDRSRVRGLHPGWFAAVMGTAILAVATYDNPGNITALTSVAHGLGGALALLAYALGAVLLVAYAVRWVAHTDAALADLRHPMLGGLHATLPGGLLVLAVMTSVVGPEILPQTAVTALITVLGLVGGVLALVMGVAFGYTLFTGETPAPAVNGGWFIPPVVTIIIPMVLIPLMAHTSASNAQLLLFAGYACFGMGFMLFLFVMGMLHDRMVLHPLPPAQLAPSLWIGLGPVALATLAPLALASAGQATFGTAGPAVVVTSQVFGTAIWGFGLWWLAIAVTLLGRYLRAGALPFHLGWWAFVFPLGAYTVATLTLARVWQVAPIEALSGLLYLALAAFWLIVTVRTVASTRSGAIWRR